MTRLATSTASAAQRWLAILTVVVAPTLAGAAPLPDPFPSRPVQQAAIASDGTHLVLFLRSYLYDWTLPGKDDPGLWLEWSGASWGTPHPATNECHGPDVATSSGQVAMFWVDDAIRPNVSCDPVCGPSQLLSYDSAQGGRMSFVGNVPVASYTQVVGGNDRLYVVRLDSPPLPGGPPELSGGTHCFDDPYFHCPSLHSPAITPDGASWIAGYVAMALDGACVGVRRGLSLPETCLVGQIGAVPHAVEIVLANGQPFVLWAETSEGRVPADRIYAARFDSASGWVLADLRIGLAAGEGLTWRRIRAASDGASVLSLYERSDGAVLARRWDLANGFGAVQTLAATGASSSDVALHQGTPMASYVRDGHVVVEPVPEAPQGAVAAGALFALAFLATRRRARGPWIAAVGCAFGIVTATGAGAAVITVSTMADAEVADGNCSLREAIHAAAIDASIDACAAGSGADTIAVPAGTVALTSTLDLQRDLTIQGGGVDATFLDGGDAVQVFRRVGPAGPIEIRDLSIEHGHGVGGGGMYSASAGPTTFRSVAVRRCTTDGRGGAIIANGSISIVDGVFESNVASDHPSGFNSGGAIYMTSGDLVVERSRFERNRVVGTDGELYGGAIHFASTGTLEISASSFAANSAGYSGGAVMALFANHALVTDSVFDRNFAGPGAKGGALILGSLSFTTSFAIENVTFSGNLAGGAGPQGSGAGGALAILGPGSCSHCTFVDNRSYFFDTIVGDSIYDEVGGLDLASSVLAVRDGSNCRGVAPASGGYNLASDESCAFSMSTDVESVDPMLGLLGDNGGPTWTHVPLPGSPLIDAIATSCPVRDQRGIARPQDGDADGVADCDIGAVEVVPEPPGAALTAALLVALGRRATRCRAFSSRAGARAAPRRSAAGATPPPTRA